MWRNNLIGMSLEVCGCLCPVYSIHMESNRRWINLFLFPVYLRVRHTCSCCNIAFSCGFDDHFSHHCHTARCIFYNYTLYSISLFKNIYRKCVK